MDSAPDTVLSVLDQLPAMIEALKEARRQIIFEQRRIRAAEELFERRQAATFKREEFQRKRKLGRRSKSTQTRQECIVKEECKE